MDRTSRLGLATVVGAIVATAALAPRSVAAGNGQCHVVAVDFTPADRLQIVAWVEKPTGEYVATVYLTQQTGLFGLGNRPGRFDFNSGPLWPYGRRITVLPVWAHRTGLTFPTVIFQNSPDDPDVCATSTGNAYTQCGENALSHPFSQSSREVHFCRPLQQGETGWDSMTCATTAFSDKGRFSPVATSIYPPRVDLTRTSSDSPSVDMYKALNPFDAISQATPPGGMQAAISWPIPQGLAQGDYVMWVEVGKEGDNNATYNATSYPSPCAPSTTCPNGITFADYGVAYRGQPSIVYKVPFTIGATESIASTMSYAGYGDPTGADGILRAPDATITTDTPGSGGSRLQVTSDTGSMFRVRVDARPEIDNIAPDAPGALTTMSNASSTATFSFVAPGDDGQIGRVTGYEIRYLANSEMTADNFAAGLPITATVSPVDPGGLQTFELDGLLPETDYWIGVQAYDKCHNTSPLAIVKITTADRQSGTVDACFVATAAYGSVMANDVELLRHFRDSLLERTVLGELAVETYYTFGPAVAGVVGESELLRATARDVLAPVVRRVRELAF